MRLEESETLTIKEEILKHDSDASIYLYGSRVHDEKKGGDIDLYVVSQKITFSQKLEILSELKNRIGDQKIDIKLSKDSTTDPFFSQIKKDGLISLN